MPFLTAVASGGGAASYAPALSEVSRLFVIANYGSAQGYDNDDGSAYDHSHHNFFYQADGFKMFERARQRTRSAPGAGAARP